MIVVEQLRKRYGAVDAVRGVSFRANNGQVTGVLGPNGAGKTTTLRIISTLVRPDSGTATIDGIDVQKSPREALHRLGVLPDSRGLYPRLTAHEHLEYFGRLHGMSVRDVVQRIEELTELLDMREIIHRRVAGFSQGERTKVAIGRAIVHRPDHLILDEASNGLDVMSRRALRRVVRSLAEAGCCVLLSSHVMQEVSAICDTVAVFRRGEVVATGSADALMEQTGAQNLEEAFVQVLGTDEGIA